MCIHWIYFWLASGKCIDFSSPPQCTYVFAPLTELSQIRHRLKSSSVERERIAVFSRRDTGVHRGDGVVELELPPWKNFFFISCTLKLEFFVDFQQKSPYPLAVKFNPHRSLGRVLRAIGGNDIANGRRQQQHGSDRSFKNSLFFVPRFADRHRSTLFAIKVRTNHAFLSVRCRFCEVDFSRVTANAARRLIIRLRSDLELTRFAGNALLERLKRQRRRGFIAHD